MMYTFSSKEKAIVLAALDAIAPHGGGSDEYSLYAKLSNIDYTSNDRRDMDVHDNLVRVYCKRMVDTFADTLEDQELADRIRAILIGY